MAEKKDSDGKILAWLFLISLVAFGFYIYRWSTPESLIHIDRGEQAGATNASTGESTNQAGLVLGETSASQCLEKPQHDYGSCSMFLGVYVVDGQCQRVYGCDLQGDVPPFFSMGECQQACQTVK